MFNAVSDFISTVRWQATSNVIRSPLSLRLSFKHLQEEMLNNVMIATITCLPSENDLKLTSLFN